MVKEIVIIVIVITTVAIITLIVLIVLSTSVMRSRSRLSLGEEGTRGFHQVLQPLTMELGRAAAGC